MTNEIAQQKIGRPLILECHRKIPVKCQNRNRLVPIFLVATVVLTVASLFYLQIDWIKLLRRVPDIRGVLWELGH